MVRVARLQILASALLFSTGGVAIKAISLDRWQIAGWRSGIAALVLLAVLPESRRGWDGRTLLVSAPYAGALVCYVLANTWTTAASTIFLYAVAPLYILVLGPLLLGERWRRRDLPFMAALAAGMTLLLADLGGAAESAPEPLKGNLMALAGGICWALLVVGLRWLSRGGERRETAATAVVAGNVLAFALCLPVVLAGAAPVAAGGGRDWLLLAYLGAFQIGLAYVFLTRGLRSVTALEVSLLMLLEPVLNPLWAWWAHGERPGRLALAGGVVILAATALHSYRYQTSRPTGQ